MSADNYYLIRKHPHGGFAAVMGFESDDRVPKVRPNFHKAYPTVEDALDFAHSDWTEYGVTVHLECMNDLASQGDGEAGPAHADSLRAPGPSLDGGAS